jgi:hypothetical protein
MAGATIKLDPKNQANAVRFRKAYADAGLKISLASLSNAAMSEGFRVMSIPNKKYTCPKNPH